MTLASKPLAFRFYRTAAGHVSTRSWPSCKRILKPRPPNKSRKPKGKPPVAKIIITIEGSQVGTISVTDTLSQENSDRFMAWLAATYGTGTDENGEPKQNGPAEMVADCWGAIKRGVFDNIARAERDELERAAREGVQPVTSEATEVTHEPPEGARKR